jgi:hypothetical protein
MSLESLQRLDPRWIFVAFLIAVSIPIIQPLGLPIKIGENTRRVYRAVDELPDGSLVVLTPDFSYDNRGELLPMLEAFLKHLLSKDVKVISVGFYGATSPMLMEEAMRSVGLENYGKEYGVDFVNLGFLVGAEPTIAAFGQDTHALVKVDYYGTPISEIPIMEYLHDAGDIDLEISLAAGMNYPELYLRQWQTTFGTKVTGGSVGLIYAPLSPYIATGQLEGYLPSLRGAAEYELLIQKPGSAIVGMDSQSLVHIVVIVAIIISNIGVLGEAQKKAKGTTT